MISSRYLLRFDDVCPTMNWKMWTEIESILVDQNIRPILAVVPDNRDLKLQVAPERKDFWERVREWHQRGWTIAVHGYQHVYVNRHPGLLGITPQSEFAGLGHAEQFQKISAAVEIFRRESIPSEVWVAPSHSFDRVTLGVLAQLGFKVVSDGLLQRVYKDKFGLVWVPCQLWQQVQLRRSGVWTICQHHNQWSSECLNRFRRDVIAYRDQIAALEDVSRSDEIGQLSVIQDVRVWMASQWRFRLRREVKRLLRRLNLRDAKGRFL